MKKYFNTSKAFHFDYFESSKIFIKKFIDVSCLFLFLMIDSVHAQRVSRDESINLLDSGISRSINGWITSIIMLADNKIISTCNFSTHIIQNANDIARLNANWSLDNAFIPGTGLYGIGGIIVASLSDGKIILGRQFNLYKGTLKNRIARVKSKTINLLFALK